MKPLRRFRLACLVSCIGLFGVACDDESNDGDTAAGDDSDSGNSSGNSDSGPGDSGNSDSGNSDSGNSGGESGGNSGGDDVRQACVDRINAFRETEGLPPYERWTAAEDCSDQQAEDDANGGGAHGNFGACNENAQNTCPGWPSFEGVIQGCLQSMWDEGPGENFQEHGHYINMSSTQYTQVACGFYEMPDGSIWANQNFR